MSNYQQEAIDRLQVNISEYMAREIDKAILAERERIVEVLQHKLDNALLPDGNWTLAFSYAIALINEDFNE